MFSPPRVFLLQLTLILALGLSACGSLFGTSAPPTSAVPSAQTLPPETPTPAPPPLAATVNGEWITAEELEAEVERYRAAQLAPGSQVSLDEATSVVLKDLIDQVLLAQAARADGFEITAADLQSRIDALTAELGSADSLTAWISANGYTDQSFRSALKRATEAAWMRDKIISAVPRTMEQVHARQILLYNEETALAVADRLAAGADFEALAALYDPTTAGELSWFPRGYLLEPQIEEAAFSLEPGQHSQMITTDVGYHFVYVIARDAERPLAPDAYLVMQENALRDWLTQQRTLSEIVLAP
ncbi:MAG: peptidylprolyl isomerase [Anaerolineales bacterium]